MRLQLISAVVVVVACSMTAVIHLDEQPGGIQPYAYGASVKQIQLDLSTSDKNASVATQRTLQQLAYYSQNPQVGILSGQNIGHTANRLDISYRQTWTKLNVLRGLPTPAIMSIDLGLNTTGNTDGGIMLLEEHAKAGGLVSVSMHPANPWTGGAYDDCRSGLFESLTTPGRLANDRWKSWLRRTGNMLAELQQRQITVLWRPFHEANGDWFWWCVGGKTPALTPKQFQQLWHEMHDYLHNERELHNLLWVYSVNVRYGPEVGDFKTPYPGREFVDIAAIDFYGDITTLAKEDDYRQLRSFGKVVAMSEFGSRPMDGTLDAKVWLECVKQKFPHLAYFVSWHSWPQASVALADLNEAKSILASDFVINLDGLQPAKPLPGDSGTTLTKPEVAKVLLERLNAGEHLLGSPTSDSSQSQQSDSSSQTTQNNN